MMQSGYLSVHLFHELLMFVSRSRKGQQYASGLNGLPFMRLQFGNLTRTLRRQVRENVLQIAIWVIPIQEETGTDHDLK